MIVCKGERIELDWWGFNLIKYLRELMEYCFKNVDVIFLFLLEYFFKEVYKFLLFLFFGISVLIYFEC